RCLEGTRMEVLQTIKESIDESGSRSITWMYGLVGLGKYTINLTLADFYARQKRLAASFFIPRDYPELDRLDCFVPTITSHLMSTIPGFRGILRKTLQDDSTLLNQSFGFQFEKLILDPLSQVPPRKHSMVVILDLLHHC
ncbi:hypothetical protein CPB84DRAFT_1628266, partial [Gymnopilus junonius]